MDGVVPVGGLIYLDVQDEGSGADKELPGQAGESPLIWGWAACPESLLFTRTIQR